MSARPLLLPIETINREFDGKLLLALHAAERGWRPIIGERTALHAAMGEIPSAVYLSKGFKPGTGPVNRIVHGLGHAIVGLDEESLVNVSDDMVLLRMDPEILRMIRMTCTWGDNDARLFGRLEGLNRKPIIATGNPRVDLLRPELAGYFAPEVAAIREQFGHFALFNTNFAMVNHFIPGQTRFRAAEGTSVQRVEEFTSGLLGHKARLLEAFRVLIPRLAAALAPDALVIRPHPSENWQFWRDAAQGLDNVHVVHEGTVVPWLAAADVLLHNGCTSAVEAALIGTPALSYRPVKAPGYDNDLPNGLSLEFEHADALIAEAVAAVRRRRTTRHALDPARRALLDAHVSAVTGPFACTRLIDAIEQNADLLQPDTTPARRAVMRCRCFLRRVRRSLRRVFGVAAGTSGKREYRRHKFAGMTTAEVNRRIARLQATLGRFDGTVAEEIAPDLFRIAVPAARP